MESSSLCQYKPADRGVYPYSFLQSGCNCSAGEWLEVPPVGFGNESNSQTVFSQLENMSVPTFFESILLLHFIGVVRPWMMKKNLQTGLLYSVCILIGLGVTPATKACCTCLKKRAWKGCQIPSAVHVNSKLMLTFWCCRGVQNAFVVTAEYGVERPRISATKN